MKQLGKLLALVVGVTASATGTGSAQTIDGRAAVIDGDTLDVAGQRIRLFGIDAPELRQTCFYLGQQVACGRMAADALAYAVAARPVSCQQVSRDQYNRIVAICRIGSGSAAVELNAWLVQNGAAVAERRFSERYVAAEQSARQLRAGIWGSEFELPREWRRKNR